MPAPPSHRFEPHVGELRVALRAPSLATLFEEAARALAEVMAGAAVGPGGAGDDAVERVTLTAPDREALLVDWLNELIFLGETRRRIYDRVRVEHLDDRGLTAEVRGRPSAGERTLVKAATFHGLQIREGDAGLTATVLLDI